MIYYTLLINFLTKQNPAPFHPIVSDMLAEGWGESFGDSSRNYMQSRIMEKICWLV